MSRSARRPGDTPRVRAWRRDARPCCAALVLLALAPACIRYSRGGYRDAAGGDAAAVDSARGEGRAPDGARADAPRDAARDQRATDAPRDAARDRRAIDAAREAAAKDLNLCSVSSGDCGPSKDGAVQCWFPSTCGQTYKGPGARLWPDVTDATGPLVGSAKGCSHTLGFTVPSVGPGSASWFDFIDCGTYKEFPTGKGCALRIVSYADCNCPTCMLRDIRYQVQEKTTTQWVTKLTIDHPYVQTKCDGYIDTFVPTTSRVRIVAVKPAYVCVFQE